MFATRSANLRNRAILCVAALLAALTISCTVLPATANANVRKADVVVGETVQSRGLSVTQCPDLYCERAYLIDSDGNVYFERNASDSANIASITKVMTAIVAIESVPIDTTITVSSTAAAIGESTAELKAGDTMPLSTALSALLIPSGNDAAEAIAESVGSIMLQSEGGDWGSTDACVTRFVEAMNKKASELGLENTVYSNPHGLDYDEWAGSLHSCAKDVATVGAYAMGKQAIRDVTSKSGDTITVTRDGASKSITLQSTDELIGDYDGVIGIKTGYTELAGACYAGAVERNGRIYYAIILDSEDEAQRFVDATNLWDWAFKNQVDYTLAHSSQTTVNAKTGQTVPLVAKVSDTMWTDKTINATFADPNASVSVFALSGNVSQSVEYKEITGDVHAGDVVGKVTFKQRNNVIATQDLVATEDVAAPNLFEGFGVWWSKFTSGNKSADSVLVNTTPLLNDKSGQS